MCIAILATAMLAVVGSTTTKSYVELAERTAASILAHPSYTQPGCATGCCFSCWGYCGGLIFYGLGRALDRGLLRNFTLRTAVLAALNERLDFYRDEPGQEG